MRGTAGILTVSPLGVTAINRLVSRLSALTLLTLSLLPPFLFHPALADPKPASIDPHYFDYDARAPFPITQTPDKAVGGVQVVRVTFPSPVVTPYPVNNVVTGFLFLPAGTGRHPLMLVEHEWLPKTLDNESRTAASLARAGIAAFLIVQPYSYNRRLMPRVPDVELLSGDVPQMVGAFHQAVLDNRRALDWLVTRPDIDPNHIGVTGISLGAMLAPLIAGVDPRVRYLVTIVGGADVADTVFDSFITYGLRPSLLYHGVTYDSLKRDMAPIEPTNWLHGFDARNALLFDGRYDVFINPKQARRLSRALGGARIVWTPTGHYGAIFAENQIEAVGVRFLRSRFGLDTAPYVPPASLRAPTFKIGLLVGGQEGFSPAVAYQVITFGPENRLSLDGQLTLHGLSVAPSVRLDESNSVGLEFPLLHGKPKPRLFYMLHFVL